MAGLEAELLEAPSRPIYEFAWMFAWECVRVVEKVRERVKLCLKSSFPPNSSFGATQLFMYLQSVRLQCGNLPSLPL